MKTIFTTLMLSLIIMKSVYSQNNNLVVYSQDGLKFTVILNGIRQNASPQTNVKVTGLNAPNYQVKVIFENKLPDLNQNAYLMNGGETVSNTEFSYSIVNKKGTYKLKPASIAPIEASAAAVTTAEQTVVTYSPVDVAPVTPSIIVDNTGSTNVTMGTTGGAGTTTTTTTTTTNTTGGANVNGGTVGMTVNGTGVGLGININITDPTLTGTTTNNTTTTTTYSTTTTTSGGTMTETNMGGGTVTGTTVTATDNSNAYVLPGYNGVYGCAYPMGGSDFADAKKSIASKGFDDTRLTIAKQIIGSNCLLCSQIKELMELMSFEQTKLDLAKFAWHHNLDKGNYYKLNDAFTFSSSVDELNQYTQSH